MADWKDRLGILYSTNPDYEYQRQEVSEVETVAPERQTLCVGISRKYRAGKEVTVVEGFIGTSSDCAALGKILKQRCGVGGSTKDGEILIQGDQRDKVVALLIALGYTRTKRSN